MRPDDLAPMILCVLRLCSNRVVFGGFRGLFSVGLFPVCSVMFIVYFGKIMKGVLLLGSLDTGNDRMVGV